MSGKLFFHSSSQLADNRKKKWAHLKKQPIKIEGGVSRGKDKSVPGDILTYKQGQRQE